jgi:membrane-associated phospholipid phosphatase
MKSLNFRNYKIALAISFSIAFVVFIVSYFIGHQEFFLLLNGDEGRIADYFFEYFTNAGDGLMWIPVLLITLFVLKRRDVLPLLISAFAISTIMTQIFKYLIVPDEPRPIKAIADRSLIHVVPGVELHTVSSFPSGHTGTAFCFYILFCLLLHKNWWMAVGLIFALLVAYSRVYLAQHFPFDLAGGILVAIITMIVSVKIQKWWWEWRSAMGRS